MDNRMVGTRLSVMMFLEFFIWGAWYVTAGNFMKAHGMFDQVYLVYTVGPIAALVSPFFLGLVADRFFPTQRILGVMHLLGGVAMFFVPLAAGAGPTVFILVLLAHTLCYMPTLGLTNTLAFHNIESQEKQFPIIRVFGTIGWIAANFVVSSLLHADFSAAPFHVTAAACVALGLYSFTLPHTPPPAKGKKVSLREIAGIDALRLMKEPSFAVFIVCSFLICIPLAAYYAFAPIFAGKVGFTDPASNMMFGQVSEILFMIAMPLFFIRLGVKYMLLVGMAAWVARYGLFSGADAGNVTWMVLAGIALHGICYDFFFVTGFIYTDKKCKPEIRGQAQGFLVLVTQGLGLGIGAQVMGWVVGRYTPAEAAALNTQANELSKQAFGLADSDAAKPLFDQARALGAQASRLMDWQMIWLIPALAAAVVMLVFFGLFREGRRPAAGRQTETPA